MIFFGLFALALSQLLGPSEFEITVCDQFCPSFAKGQQIVYTSSVDLDKALSDYLTDQNIIYFYSNQREATDFYITLSTFQSRKCTFCKLDTSTNIDLVMRVDGPSQAELSFQEVDITFSSTTVSQLRIDSLKFIDSQINFDNIDNELFCGSLTTDDSILSFSRVTIVNADYVKSQVTFDMTTADDINITIYDKKISTYVADKTFTIVYESTEAIANFELESDYLTYIEGYSTSAAEMPTINLENFKKIIFSGNFPDATKIFISEKRLDSSIEITSFSSILPISRIGDSLTTITLNDSATITGDFECPLVFKELDQLFQSDLIVNMKGTYSGNSFDLGCSWIRLTLAILDADFENNLTFPFIFRVGIGGASTVNVLKTTAEETKMNTLAIYPEFTEFASDLDLERLIKNEWIILEINITLNSTESNILLQTEPFVHGFYPDDCCMTIVRMYQNYTLSTLPPSSIPLKLCYGTSCSASDGYQIGNVEDIRDIFKGGMTQLILTLTQNVNNIPFTDYYSSFYDSVVTINGKEGVSINSISFGSQNGIKSMIISSIEFTGNTKFFIDQIEFKQCKAATSSHFSYKSDINVIGDDDFVSNFLSKSEDLYTFRYKMDKFDAISVDSSEYIFYDLDLNDFSDPIRFTNSLVTNFEIIYDVGMTQTAHENNLNVTINTNKPPSFNVTFELLSHDYRTEAEFILYNWSMAQSANYTINFDHQAYPVKVVYTEPYRPLQLNVIGSGKVTYIDRYSNHIDYCLCSGDDSCKNICPSNSSISKPTEIDNLLDDNSYQDKTFYIALTKLYSPIEFTYHKVNSSSVKFIGLGEGDDKDTIIINNENEVLIDDKLTTTHFANLIVKPSSNTRRIVFGELQFTNCTITGFENIEVTIDDFYCVFDDFSHFKSPIEITDNCFVSGEMAQEEATVDIQRDENAHDLQVNISVDCDMEIGNNYVKFGKTKFLVGRAMNYDCVIDIEADKTLNIVRGSGASDNSMPLVLIRNGTGGRVIFCDGWDPEPSKEYIFLFDDVDKMTITLNGDDTPMAVSALQGDLTIIAGAEVVGLNGFFEFREKSLSDRHTINLLYDDSKLSSATIKFEKLLDIGRGTTMKFSQPNIVLTIASLRSDDPTNLAVLDVYHYSDLTGDSCLKIANKFVNCRISTYYKVQVVSDKPITDRDVINYISNDHVLFEVNVSDASSLRQSTFELIEPLPTTHGFTRTNLEMRVNEQTGQIRMAFITSPIFLPWTICYDHSPCEFTVDESNISNLESFLPGGALSMVVKVSKSNTNPFDFSSGYFKGSSVEFLSSTPEIINVNVKFGQNILNQLTLTQIIANSQEETVTGGALILNKKANTNKMYSFQNLSVDMETWTNLHLNSYSNSLEIRYSDSSFTFTSNGWKLSNNEEISYSNFPKFSVEFVTSNGSPQLNCDSGLTMIKPMTMKMNTNEVLIGENFGALSKNSPIVDIQSTIPSDQVVVKMSSFPFIVFPYLMKAQSFEFNQGALPYTNSNPIFLNGTTLLIDFKQATSATEGVFTANSVEFNGTTAVYSQNSQAAYPFVFKNVYLNSSAITYLSKVQITDSLNLNGDTTLRGDFSVDSLSYSLGWQLNEMPEIYFNSEPTNIPKSIVFSFIGSETEKTLDTNAYNDFLYQKVYPLITPPTFSRCSEWVSKIQLNSSIKYFNSASSVFDIECNDNRLVLVGRRKIPDIVPPTRTNSPTQPYTRTITPYTHTITPYTHTITPYTHTPTAKPTDSGDSTDGGSKSLKPGAIAAIVLSVLIVVIAVVVFVVLRFRNKQRLYLGLHSDKLETPLNDDKYTDELHGLKL